METDVYIRSSRRKHNQIRLLEKQIRPEIIERCLQFIDVVIHQIIYQENIYPSSLIKFLSNSDKKFFFFLI